MTYPKKSLGQHFLMHRQTAERIVLAAEVTLESTVLEIGPGTGILTRALLKVAKKVIAVEADTELLPKLQEEFCNEIEEGKLVLIGSDIRIFDPKSIQGSYLLVANIPYYITGEIIRQFLGTGHKPSSLTLLVQKEVAVRIARSTKESLLSLSVKAYGTPHYRFTVPKGAFFPAPSVDSAVLSITGVKTQAFASNAEEARFFTILHAGFAHKRKRLAKNLEAIASASAIANIFAEIGLFPNVRAEDVSLSAWQLLAQKLSL
ncbi:ribosomal RNA small subunit methyltransferase A [Patescibacteria group bacterium]|nr:ribosomal RNA small subunit methyltransferase A [Patescibacteria group bacterium]